MSRRKMQCIFSYVFYTHRLVWVYTILHFLSFSYVNFIERLFMWFLCRINWFRRRFIKWINGLLCKISNPISSFAKMQKWAFLPFQLPLSTLTYEKMTHHDRKKKAMAAMNDCYRSGHATYTRYPHRSNMTPRWWWDGPVHLHRVRILLSSAFLWSYYPHQKVGYSLTGDYDQGW